VVTGAAGSIVSAITADLAAASGGTFYLLDLTPEPDAANPDLKRFASDREGLKREIFARMQARGERATPVMVEKEIAGIERAHAAAQAIAAVRAAGGEPRYYSVDLTDPAAVANVVEEVRRRSGRIDVLLHAAGMERSHFLPDKDAREFDLVFDVKADGWFNLLHASGEMPVQAAVVFSSVAGRFGNAGQTDYSAANDLLCKCISNFRTTRPQTRGIAIDWTAWAGIGMAARGSIPRMMELAGIEMLPPEAGIPWIRHELTDGGQRGEVVVAGKLGVLLKEWDESGGLAVKRPLAGPMLGHPVAAASDGRITIEATLDPAAQPFLHDHQIDGTPVLPGVMGIEAFAEAALACAPGWSLESMEDVCFLSPFKFYRGEPRTLAIEADFRLEGEHLIADCRLVGRRILPNRSEPQTTVHFTGRVRLSKSALPCTPAAILGKRQGHVFEAAGIYQVYFHGPAYQVLRRAWCSEKQAFGEMARGLPANHSPKEMPLAAAPRLIEVCFQTAGLWEMSVQHRMGLPWRVEGIRFYSVPEKHEEPLFALVTPVHSRDAFDAEVVDSGGNRYLQLTGYRTVAFRDDIDAALVHGLEAVGV
jgi:NAD(P)-dependent dehydrogenase (short-subunit alcohol dehydrogenase family)